MILIMYCKYLYFLYKINQSYFSENENDSYLGTEEVGPVAPATAAACYRSWLRLAASRSLDLFATLRYSVTNGCFVKDGV